MTINGQTVVAGVVGAPVAHSLSPLIHNAWLAAGDVDGVYVPFTPPAASLHKNTITCATSRGSSTRFWG